MESLPVPNPYDALLEDVDHDPNSIQALFETDWDDKTAGTRAKFLGDNFLGVQRDLILVNLLNDPDFEDPRNSLVFWARPTRPVVDLVVKCRDMLQKLSPSLWLQPQDCLHMTVLVVAHSLTPDEISSLVHRAYPSLRSVASVYHDHRARLVKPRISFDEYGVALSFVPAGDDILDNQIIDPQYTFLHLRRDMFDQCREHVQPNAQKAPTSCYVTIARFVSQEDHSRDGRPDPAALITWANGIEQINQTLANEYWPKSGIAPEAGNWVIGGRVGLDLRQGTSWYGGGQSLDVD